jgi:L-fucose isomerase-like protein
LSATLENLEDKGIVVGMEGDLSTTLAMLILSKLSRNPAQFVEILRFDKKNNTILIGHHGCAGIHLAKSNTIKLTSPWVPLENYLATDFKECVNGVSLQYILKPGEVTLLNISCDEVGYKMTFTTGEILDENPRNIKMPHALFRPQKPVSDFLRELISEGVKHHFALTYGNIVNKLIKLADILNLRKKII